jgi:hypothetical protein
VQNAGKLLASTPESQLTEVAVCWICCWQLLIRLLSKIHQFVQTVKPKDKRVL